MQPLWSLPFLNTVSPFLNVKNWQVSAAYFNLAGSRVSCSWLSLMIFHMTFLLMTNLRLSPRLVLTF